MLYEHPTGHAVRTSSPLVGADLAAGATLSDLLASVFFVGAGGARRKCRVEVCAIDEDKVPVLQRFVSMLNRRLASSANGHGTIRCGISRAKAIVASALPSGCSAGRVNENATFSAITTTTSVCAGGGRHRRCDGQRR